MLRSLVRLALRAAVLALVVSIARAALKRWVDGPDPVPSSAPWPEVPVPTVTAAPSTSPSWVESEPDGGAPDSHPVKAKLSSRLYHLPGMAAYARTRADRCYPTPETAEADGFTRAKR